MRGLVIHSVVFGVINALLIAIWLVTTGSTDTLNSSTTDPLGAFSDGMWPLAVIAAWGSALVIHATVVVTRLPGQMAQQVTRRTRRGGQTPPEPPAVPAPPAAEDVSSARDLGQSVAKAAMGLVESFTTKTTRSGKPAIVGRQWITAMFTDLVSSTDLAERLGDAAWHRVLADHRALVRESIERRGGTEVGTQGDGFLVRFETPDAAVGCAMEIQRAMAANRSAGSFTPEVRIGIHAGEVVADDNDLVGRVINLAARVTSAAEPSEILVTEPVADHLSPGVPLNDRGLVPLKGIAQPRHLLCVEWLAIEDIEQVGLADADHREES